MLEMKLYLLAAALLVAALAAVIGVVRASVTSTALEEDPERASFMVECVYGWGQAPQNCEAILRGDAPSPLPSAEP